jgi:hypothetical protein
MNTVHAEWQPEKKLDRFKKWQDLRIWIPCLAVYVIFVLFILKEALVLSGCWLC